MEMSNFSKSGEGWFEDNLGISATDVVHRLRKARRHNKDEKHLKLEHWNYKKLFRYI